ncbi:MAG: hypothetical protein V1773_01750 [bacterium]
MSIIKKITTYRANWIDVLFIKLGVFTATLFFAKIYEPILSLEWYWYLLLWIILSIKPVIGYVKWFYTICINKS